MNRRIICCSVFILALVTSLIIFYRYHQFKSFTCASNYYVSYKKNSLKALFRLVISGSEGIVVLTGEVQDEEGKQYALNRQMVFTFDKRGSSYLMHSEKAVKEYFDKVDHSLLEQLLNPFFYEEGKYVQYVIRPQSNGNYVIVLGRLPIIYCLKANNT